ncbi:MAG: hypothetical protein PGN13_07470 [Patulibacter minatonensis]
MEAVDLAVGLTRDARHAYSAATPQERALMNTSLFKAIYVYADAELEIEIELEDPFEELIEATPETGDVRLTLNEELRRLRRSEFQGRGNGDPSRKTQ